MSADPARPPPPTPAGNEAGLAKGATIGRYVVLGLLGRGGMGEVYAAYDPELDRKIAVKLLRARAGGSTADGRTRLLREAQGIAPLSAPTVGAPPPGLVHRDFKPENVMITKAGQVRVMDFGLARETGADQPSPSQQQT